jgi:uncharacterized membrane protein
MEEHIKEITRWIALTLESVGVLVIAAGSVFGIARIVIDCVRGLVSLGWRMKIWVDFGVWLMMGLEFLLAADIVRSAVAPTWDNIGQLAAIAAIRTFLNFFLERDISEAYSAGAADKATAPSAA